MIEKHGFGDVTTLHALITKSPSDPDIIGTDVILSNLSDKDMDGAKALFLNFSREKLIESTNYGAVYIKSSDTAKIFINDVKVAEEKNFLFSYNITSLTQKIRKALNRERTNVGRNAYRDRIIKILLLCEKEDIGSELIKDLQNREEGTSHDELSWSDIQEHAVKILNSKKNAVFMTSSEIQNSFHLIEDAKSRGLEIITIPKSLREKIHNSNDISGNPIRDVDYFIKEDMESFRFKFVKPKQLKKLEKEIFNLKDRIFELIGGKPKEISKVKISESMRKDPKTFREAVGLWIESTGTIIIKRDQLKAMEDFCGTLLHEIAHCISNRPDVDGDFELELSRLLGVLCSKILKIN